MSRTATAILSTENLIHNVSVIRNIVGKSKIIAMVKANAYGHGLRSTSLRLMHSADMLGVASIDEALDLRKSGVTCPIMLAEGVFEANELKIAAAEGFHVVFHHVQQLSWLEESYAPLPLRAWLKIDTGMGRLGLNYIDAQHWYEKLQINDKVTKPIHIMSHLACAGQRDHRLNMEQLQGFDKFIANKHGRFSICNSAAIIHFPEYHYDYVRPGLSIYGISPIAGISSAQLGLKPVMTLQTTIISTKIIAAGKSVGYDAMYICPCDMPTAIIAFGYGDGYPMSTYDGIPVLIHGIECPIIGRVSMDMIAVDLRQCPTAKIGDVATLWGEGLPLERVAQQTQQISWCMLTSIQHRVKFLWTHYDMHSSKK